MGRITERFARLKADKRAGLVAYVSAGDPDLATSYEILKGLPKAGADVIELGMPFTDPMADGPSIQLAGQRADLGLCAVDHVAPGFGVLALGASGLAALDWPPMAEVGGQVRIYRPSDRARYRAGSVVPTDYAR